MKINSIKNYRIGVYYQETEGGVFFSFFASDKYNKDFFYSEVGKNLQNLFNDFFDKNVFFDEFQKVDGVFINGNKKIKILGLERNPIFIENGEDKNFEIKTAKRFLEKINCRILDASSGNIYNKEKKKILLHVCCGVDVVYPILTLKDRFELIAYWYDPNIHPKCEYDKRFNTFKDICDRHGIEIIKGEYDAKSFLEKIQHLKNTPEMGEKCTVCYDYRLGDSAKLAQKIGVDAWTTTLNSSPLKSFEKLTKIGNKYEKKFGIPYLAINFRKGQNETSKYCKNNGVYRQNYCGCVYSDTFPEEFDKLEIEKGILEK